MMRILHEHGRVLLWALVIVITAAAIAALDRVGRVTQGAEAIPIYPDAREGPAQTRYLPRLLSWDERSSARVRRVFALAEPNSLQVIARHADAILAPQGWYLLNEIDLRAVIEPQVIVWQREPDERLDLTKLWPLDGMTREQRLYGNIFPAAFLDEPFVFEWSWMLGGSHAARPAPPSRSIMRPIPPPPMPAP